MSEERRNAILQKAYRLIETPIVPHVSPPQTWTPPRQAQSEPAPVVRKSVTDFEAMNIRNQLDAHVARYDADRTAIRECLEAIADETGAAIGKLQKQVDELQWQLNETCSELALMRVLQPKRSLGKAHDVRANGSDAHVN